jgi:hypothetical protein
LKTGIVGRFDDINKPIIYPNKIIIIAHIHK